MTRTINIDCLICPPLSGYNFVKNRKQDQAAHSPLPKFKNATVVPEPFGMIIVTSFTINYNSNKDYYEIKSEESSCCPYCNGELKYRNSRFRKSKNLAGDLLCYILRRLLCFTCNTLHTEIPSKIQPYKHYDSQTIQAVLDGSEDALACAADDSTIYRWKKTFSKSEADIEQRLSSICAQEICDALPISAGTQLLAQIKSLYGQWLAFVMAQLINRGHALCTQFAFCLPPAFDKVCRKDRFILKRRRSK